VNASASPGVLMSWIASKSLDPTSHPQMRSEGVSARDKESVISNSEIPIRRVKNIVELVCKTIPSKDKSTAEAVLYKIFTSCVVGVGGYQRLDSQVKHYAAFLVLISMA
jgi:hypothetical protein